MNDGDEPTDVLADADEQGLVNPASDQVDFGRDDDPSAGASDIGGRAGDQDDDAEPGR
jgi:hypothetical protein